MPRLIDLDEAHERIIKYVCENICDEPRGCSYCRASDAIDAIYEMPIVDAVPVIRCKDCRFSKPWYKDKRICSLWSERGIDVFEDGFCNYAERKEE